MGRAFTGFAHQMAPFYKPKRSVNMNQRLGRIFASGFSKQFVENPLFFPQ
jgi:hypothetical protein